MNKIIQPKTLKGFRDFLPDQMLNKKSMIKKIESNFENFGFAPIDTPCLEYTEILLGKGGDETDKQLFRFNDNGGRDVTLRFDLTVPLARFVSQHYNDLGMPLKAYHIAPVWRGENTHKGRLREFYQCDFDILGTESNFSDIEIATLIHTTISKLIGSTDFTIRVNNRMILNGLMSQLQIEDKTTGVLRIIDKIYKQPKEKIIQELQEKLALSIEQIDSLLSFIELKGTNEEILENLKVRFKENGLALKGVLNLEEMLKTFDYLEYDTLKIDLSIARGLDYYTGSVFETMLNKLPEIGSVCSGGRYDNLASLYSSNKVAGVGASVGLDRLIDAMEELKMLELKATPADVLIVMFDEKYKLDYLKMAMELREAGVKIELFNEPKKLDKQMKYANKKGFKFVITNGSNEFENKKVKIKNMISGEVFESTFYDFVQELEVKIMRENKIDPKEINLKVLDLATREKEKFDKKSDTLR